MGIIYLISNTIVTKETALLSSATPAFGVLSLSLSHEKDGGDRGKSLVRGPMPR